VQAKKPFAYLRCRCGASAFHYDYGHNTYTCLVCRHQVSGCTAKRKG